MPFPGTGRPPTPRREGAPRPEESSYKVRHSSRTTPFPSVNLLNIFPSLERHQPGLLWYDPLVRQGRTVELSMLTESQLIGAVRDLSQDDLDWMMCDGQGRSDADLNVVRNRHHRIAQLLACGEKNVSIALRLDITPQSVGTLAKSPAMKALVEYYRKEVWDKDLMIRGQLEEVALAGLKRIHADIVTRELKGSDLTRATMDLFDRAGYGPTKTLRTVSATLSMEDLRALKREAREAEAGEAQVGAKIIELPSAAARRRDEGSGAGVREGDSESPPKDVPLPSGEPVD